MPPVGANADFKKYFTFPAYDFELERLKLESWLGFIMNGENPVEYAF